MAGRPAAHARAAVAADVVERAQLAVLTAHDRDGVGGDLERDPVAGLGQLAAVAGEQPAPTPNASELEREDLRVEVQAGGQRVAFGPRGHELPGSGVVHHGSVYSFCVVMARIASSTPSLTPRPESPIPPNGVSSVRYPGPRSR